MRLRNALAAVAAAAMPMLGFASPAMADGGVETGPVKLKTQWLRNGMSIMKATETTCKLTKQDAGKQVSARVTGSKPGSLTVVKISGSKKVGKTRR
ncbi:MAG: hypothetical protein J0H64_00200 [Actinobacteria bacterium]|nr:hypothetical protein [Actinomycetota bacterium]